MSYAEFSQLVIDWLEWCRRRIIETVESADLVMGEGKKKARRLDFSLITDFKKPAPAMFREGF
jgi:hypothetical protein